MKLPTDTCCAFGFFCLARSVSSSCVMIRSSVPSRFPIALLTTVTPSMPAFLTLLRRTLAPMALEPMPASQANTTLSTRVAVAVPEPTPPKAASVSSSERGALLPSRPEVAAFTSRPLLAWSFAIAALMSPPPFARSRLRLASRKKDATANETAAERTTDRMTPT